MTYLPSTFGKSKLSANAPKPLTSALCGLLLATGAATSQASAQTTTAKKTLPAPKVTAPAKPPAVAPKTGVLGTAPNAGRPAVPGTAPGNAPGAAPGAGRATIPGTAPGGNRATVPGTAPGATRPVAPGTTAAAPGGVKPSAVGSPGTNRTQPGVGGAAANANANHPLPATSNHPNVPSTPGNHPLPGGGTAKVSADGSVHTVGKDNKPRGFESADHATRVDYGRGGRPESVTHALPGGGRIETHRLPNGQFVSRTERPDRDGRMMRIESRGGIGHIERPMYGRPGFYRHSYYDRGHSYAYVYRGYRWHGYDYYRPVPAYIYAPGFYSWGLNPWATPVVAYGWGWQAQPWYGVYGPVFTPYPAYASLDLWMTDYIISNNMRLAYEASQGAPPPPQAYADASAGPPPPPADSMPPAISDDLKAQIAAQVKLEMQEQQAAAAGGANGVAGPAVATDPNAPNPEDMPDALKAGHTTFRVTTPVSLVVNGESCTLNADDYITRLSDLKAPPGTVAVKVRASRSADCAAGGTGDIALNDLMVMQSDEDLRISEGFKEASTKMGKPGGLPAGPAGGAGEVAVPLGQAAPDPGLQTTLKQQQTEGSTAEQQALAQAGTQ